MKTLKVTCPLCRRKTEHSYIVVRSKKEEGSYSLSCNECSVIQDLDALKPYKKGKHDDLV